MTTAPQSSGGPRSGPGGPRRDGPGGPRSGPGGFRSGPGGFRSGPGGPRRDGGGRPPRRDGPGGPAQPYSEKVVLTRRVAKVVAGGKHMRFNALVVIGDGRGQVGMGMGKAEAIPDSVRKAVSIARRNLVTVPMKKSTIPHETVGVYGASRVILKPAPSGTGVIAGGTVRALMEAAGVKDVVTKSLGSRNPVNVVRATLVALQQLRDPEADAKLRRGETPPEPAREPAKV